MLVFSAKGLGDPVESHSWSSPDGQASVTLDPTLTRELARHALEGFRTLPKRGMEVGGILIGHVDPVSPARISVSAFEPIPCEHKLGPSFVLSESDYAGLEQIQAEIRRNGGQIVGYYRSYTGNREPVLEESDEELVRRCFNRDHQVVLLIKPLPGDQCAVDVVFRGAPPARSPLPLQSVAERQHSVPEVFKRRALVEEEEVPPVPQSSSKSTVWLSIALCIAVGWASAATYEWLKISREWQALNDTRTANVPSAERQIPQPDPITKPAPAAVEPPKIETPSTPVKQADPPPLSPPSVEPLPPPKEQEPVRIVAEPKVLSEIQPTVPAGIRARIQNTIVIPVLLNINASGRVVKAVPQGRGDGIYQYLAARAVAAAKEWRFSPARGSDGSAMPATKTVYFTFRS